MEPTSDTQKLYRLGTVFGVLIIVLVALMIVEKGNSLSSTWSGKNPKNTISISAEGKVKAVPDKADINVGVISQDASAEKAQKDNSEKVNKIIDFVKQEGVPAEDISTSQYNIYPNYDYSNGKNTITGYQVNQTVSIILKDASGKNKEALGKILAGVTANGANQINGVSLGFEDADNIRQEARQKAIEKAKEKAADLAKTAGIKLGRVVNISESGYATPMPYAASAIGGDALMANEKAVSPNVEPGTQDITATMSVTFEVK